MDNIKLLFEKNIFNSTANVGYFLFLILILLICINAAHKPAYNWDMIGYIGVIYSANETNTQKVQDRTYNTIRLNVPDSVYKDLTGNSILRNKAYTKPDYFANLLNFYKIKPLYIWLINLLRFAGFNIVFATLIPSIFSYFLLMILVYSWLSRYMTVLQTLTASSIIAVIKPISDLAKYSTPDLLSAVILFYALYLIALNRNDFFNIPILIVLSVLTRIDNFVFWLILLIFFILFNTNGKRKIILTSAVIVSLAVAFIIFILLFDHNLGWVNNYTEMIYRNLYWGNFKILFSEFRGSLLFYSICASVLIITLSGLQPKSDRLHYLYVACLIFIAAKFVLYPYFEERYFISSSMFIIVFIIYSVADIKTLFKNKQNVLLDNI